MIWLYILVWSVAMAQDIQVDLHLDTPSQLLRRKLPWSVPAGLEAGLVQLRKGGTNVPVMVLWPPRKSNHLQHSYRLLERIEAEVQKSTALSIARTPQQVRRLVKNGDVAVIIAMEGAHGLGKGNWRKELSAFHQRGLSMLGVTWSISNRFAGSSGDHGKGLTAEGRELIKEAHRLGIILDVSHASRQSTLELCELSRVPIIASHSNAFRIQAHARNLSDKEILCIAKTGGVIGLNFHAPFVASKANVSKVADHADYLATLGGDTIVALGSDFDGYIRTPHGLHDASQIGKLWQELRRRGWSEKQIKGVKGENFMRVWQQVIRASKLP